ncbi:Prolyl 4-hydroxylase 2 [Capsicum annuum]|nr:Prolyl 4-hydroxylase 2 [Capsicum annuum]
MNNFSRIFITFFFLLIAVFFIKSSCSDIINPSKVKQISWKPRAFVYEGFLTDEECNHLVSLAKKELKRSAVADNESGESKLSEVRTSSGMFISKAKFSCVFTPLVLYIRGDIVYEITDLEDIIDVILCTRRR